MQSPSCFRPTPIAPSDIDFWSQKFQEHLAVLNLLLLQPLTVNFGDLRSIDSIEQMIGAQESLLDEIEAGRVIFNPRFSVVDIASLIEHMIEEEDYFIRLMNQQVYLEEEIKFWLHEHETHTNLAGRLFLPSYKKEQLELIATSWAFDKLECPPYNLCLIIKALEFSNARACKLLACLEAEPTMSLLPPVLLRHEIEETNWGIHRLKYILLANSQAPCHQAC